MRRYAPPAAYAVLAVIVAGPVLATGLVLTVDLAQTPRSGLSPAYWGLPAGTNSGSVGRLPFDALWSLAGTLGLVPAAQKLLLVSIVFLAGLGMHKLARGGTPGRLFAGALYAVNPFVLERLIAGQWFLLLAYALMPWAFREFLAAGDGRARAAWRFAALTAVAGFADAHMAILLGLLCVVTALVRAPRQTPRRRALTLLALALAACASLLWLLPTPGLHELWRHVGHAQLRFYGTAGDRRWGPVLTVLGLGGFWEDATPPATALAVWPLFVVLLLALALRGATLARERRVALAVGVCAALGALAALGVSSAVTRPATFWLMDHLAALRSFRETDKAVALLAFAYAFLGAAAVDELVGAARGRRLAIGAAALALAVPLVYGGRELWGAWGTLHPVSFPASWGAADGVLRSQARGSRTLFVPFHGYLNLGFARSRVTYNPAQSYFSTSILTGRSVDQDQRLDDVHDPEQQRIRALLDDPSRPDLGRCLAALGVSHVLLAHEADWRRLAVLAQRPDMRVVSTSRALTLIALRAPGSFAMTAPVSEAGGCPGDLRPLPAALVSPVHLRLGAPVPAGRRLVLGVPDAFDWRRQGIDVRFRPWPEYRRVYEVAIAGWLVFAASALVALLIARRRRISHTR